MEIIIFEGVLTKLTFLMKFPHLSKFIDLIKDLKNMNTKVFFPCVGGSNLILGTGTENQIFFKELQLLSKSFFHQILKNDTLV